VSQDMSPGPAGKLGGGTHRGLVERRGRGEQALVGPGHVGRQPQRINRHRPNLPRGPLMGFAHRHRMLTVSPRVGLASPVVPGEEVWTPMHRRPVTASRWALTPSS